MIRPAMDVTQITQILGVAYQTFYRWVASEDKQTMPQPGTLRAIAQKLLKVSEQELEAYFNDELSLEQLLAIRPKIASLDEVYSLYASLPETEKDIAIALILRDRADAMGNVLQRKSDALQALSVINPHQSDKQNKTRKSHLRHKLLPDTVSKGDTDMSQMGDSLTPLERERLSKLLQRGVADAGYRTLRAAIVGLGFHPKELGMRALHGVYSGEEGWRIQSDDWIVIAALCPRLNEANPWLGDEPNYAPSASTYRGDVAGLKRDLACCEVCRNKRFKRDPGIKTQVN